MFSPNSLCADAVVQETAAVADGGGAEIAEHLARPGRARRRVRGSPCSGRPAISRGCARCRRLSRRRAGQRGGIERAAIAGAAPWPSRNCRRAMAVIENRAIVSRAHAPDAAANSESARSTTRRWSRCPPRSGRRLHDADRLRHGARAIVRRGARGRRRTSRSTGRPGAALRRAAADRHRAPSGA